MIEKLFTRVHNATNATVVCLLHTFQFVPLKYLPNEKIIIAKINYTKYECSLLITRISIVYNFVNFKTFFNRILIGFRIIFSTYVVIIIVIICLSALTNTIIFKTEQVCKRGFYENSAVCKQTTLMVVYSSRTKKKKKKCIHCKLVIYE